MSRNCSSYDATDRRCLSCLPGYTLNNSICSIGNCLNYDNNLNCLTCRSGFFLNNGLCYIVNCAIPSLTNCLACATGYTL